MRIAVSGATGLVGTALVDTLRASGHEILRLTRGKAQAAGDVSWDIESGTVEAEKLEGLDGVVHLAGDNIAGGRWTPEKKETIRRSRVRGTTLLSKTLAKLQNPPRVLVCASAIGYYGDRGDDVLTEESAAGTGFLPDVCRNWETSTQAADAAGIRVVRLRIGIVLSKKGGALEQMLPPFIMGAGGKLGSGKQYMSWVALEDVVGIIDFALSHDALSGPVNTVAPHAVTNAGFTRVLGDVLHRPAIFPVPAFGLKLLLGEMADDLLLASTRVAPAKLTQAGYAFRYPELKAALTRALS